MASIPGRPDDPAGIPDPLPADPNVVFAPATPRQRHQALSLLLTGRAAAGEAAVEQFLEYAATRDVELNHLWAATRRGQVLAACLLVPCAGRTGMIFLSPNIRAPLAALGAQLVRALCRAQDPGRIRLIQALLDPGSDAAESVLAAGGFAALAWLVYMRRGAETIPAALDLPEGVAVSTYSKANHALFARVILASYEQTLDCPGLLGVRHIEDIIEGHKATGRFVPELWLALHRGEEPVGVMLLNPVPARQSLELVYLGLAAAWRGRGLAGKLLRHGLGLAPRHGAAEMILAVDEANVPAMALYRAAQFLPTARKRALICVLG